MFDKFVLRAIARGDPDFPEVDCATTQQMLIRFNDEVGNLIQQHGTDKIGNAIWFLYGCDGDVARDALDVSVASGFEEFYQSLETLYAKGFAKHCSRTSKNGCMLNSACYMLWDMDSGLSHLSFNGRPELFTLVEKLIDFGLKHEHPAVQRSFLHCLAHQHYVIPDFVQKKVDVYLGRKDINSELLKYAELARIGNVL